MEMLAKPNSDKRVAFTLIRKAAEMNHTKARAELAWARTLGHYMDLDWDFEFDELSKEGLPEAHMVRTNNDILLIFRLFTRFLSRV